MVVEGHWDYRCSHMLLQPIRFPKVISSARMRVDVCEGASSRPPFCQGRISNSIRAEEAAVDGRFAADA